MAKKENYDELAKKIIGLVGGEGNISNVTHCATRLRFNLKDESKADTDAIKGTPGVLGVASANGQYQVIIGPEVTQVYEKLTAKLGDMGAPASPAEEKKGSVVSRLIDTITGIFTPILPPLTAAGMLKAVLAVLVAFKLVSSDSSTYQVVNFMADATFYFLPILLANSAAKKLGCNPYLAMMLGGILIHPNFVSMVSASQESGMAITIFGLPIYNATYSSSVIPILLGVLLMSKVEPVATRISPKAIRFFTAPLITMFVVGIATLCVLGPIGYIISNILASAINGLSTIAPWLAPTIIGALLPFLVMTGTHHALTPIGINNRMTIGFDTIIYPGQLASNIAQGAAALAVSFKTKNTELKELTSSTGITAVCGITEPVLYGVTMKIRTNMIAAMAGGGVGGFFMGLVNTKNYSGGSPGLLTLPSYIGLDAPMSNFYFACAGAAIAFVVGFAVSYILYKDPEKENS
ncbi:MAG TPA: PTS transporter subunit EIIC [Candidatus Faecalibacterium avium]|nr:PTS transporter subunit EIIC [Candidatus Faecalibacterium avium]